MPIDAAVIAGIAAEIDRLLPVKIDKIHQPYPDEFTFSGYGKGQSLKLLVSLNAQFGRLHLFDGERENPAVPSAFCMLLRKYFSASKLVNVAAVPFERIVKLVFETYEPEEGLCNKTLWAEMTGRSANLVLTATDGRIIDAWRKTTPKAGGREISNGLLYEPPSTGGRWQPVTLDRPEFAALLGQVPAGNALEKFLLKHWHGLSPLAIREIAAAAGIAPEIDCSEIAGNTAGKLFNAFSTWADRIMAAEFQPVLLEDARGPKDLSTFAVANPPSGLTVRPMASLNEAVTLLYDHPNETHRFQEIRRNLNQKVSRQLEKTALKLEKQTAEAAAAGQGDRWRIGGELLLAYGQKTPRGATSVSLPNHYEPGTEIDITLDPSRSVQENIQLYFKKYQKAKKGRQAIAIQLRRTRADLDYLQSVTTLLTNARNPADLGLIREELESEGYLRAKPLPKSGRKKAAPVPPRQFTTSAGHLILVGRNNLQNDRLTFKTAGPADWWFHTQKIPGSHVILKAQTGTEIDDATWNLACQLAAYFSQARQGTKVPVDYTQRKNVKKPPGAKPGYVIYDHFQSAIVTPDAGLLKELGLELELE